MAERSWGSAYVIYCLGCKRAWYDDGIGFGDGECACVCQVGDPHYEEWEIDPPASVVSPQELGIALAAVTMMPRFSRVLPVASGSTE